MAVLGTGFGTILCQLDIFRYMKADWAYFCTGVFSVHIYSRVVPTKAILSLKLISESGGSDVEPLYTWKKIDSKLEDDVIQIQSCSMSDPILSDIVFNDKIAWVWTTFKRRDSFNLFFRLILAEIFLAIHSYPCISCIFDNVLNRYWHSLFVVPLRRGGRPNDSYYLQYLLYRFPDNITTMT